MKHIMPLAAVGLSVLSSLGVQAQSAASTIQKSYLPERAIVVHGDAGNADSTVVGIFYSRENLDFTDADAPRFLLLDRDGKIAFGIGGAVYAVASYDFDGSIPSADFTTYDIAVPNNPARRQRFGAAVSSSSLFAKLVGHSEKFGTYQVYVQAKFNGGGNGGYGFVLKQAYAAIGHFTAGLTNSTFIDAAAQAPTVDPQGDSGQISEKTMLFRYTSGNYKGFTFAVSAEVPKVTNTYSDLADGSPAQEEISQRVPDIPAYLQYSWDEGKSHIRVAGILRNLVYRDLVSQSNRFATGWGVKLSGFAVAGIFKPFGHVSYGKGLGAFINDLGGKGYCLIPDEDPGRMTPATSLTYTLGTYVNFSKKCFATTSFSRAQALDCARLGSDSYRYGMYLALNAFYNVDDNLRFGAEYLRGWRSNYSGITGHANRFNVLMQYSF